MIYDLHSHSNHSDGHLSPSDLLARAIDNGVEHLSITDHDTLSAYTDTAVQAAKNIAVIPGIELSTQWSGHGIHIVGLNVDPANVTLQNGVSEHQIVREHRAEKIASRLTKAGLPILLARVQEIAAGGSIGRPHFAQHLVEVGAVKDSKQAFKKYLGTGKPGDVRCSWASMEKVIHWITSAGGTAVLAHPAHYRLTHRKLRQLLATFCDAGGEALEVISGSQQPEVTRRMTDAANDHGLFASCGSDFHRPQSSWSDLGRFAPLPEDCVPVWSTW